MKKTIILTLLSLLMAFLLVACGSESAAENSSEIETPQISEGSNSDTQVQKTGVWENATYLSDKEFGEGSKTFVLEVSAENKSIKFTVHTDKSTVGEALQDNGLIDGEEGQFGLYVKVVNGITADYDVNKSYWGFYIDGEYAMSGVDTTEISDGVAYKLEYTK